MKVGRLFATVILGAVVACCATAALPVHAASMPPALEPRALAHAQSIRAQLDARYQVLPGRQALAVTEASSTGVVGSFSLLTQDLLRTRFLSADDGIWYAICPVGGKCPYPARRDARPAAHLVSRRLALELALRTFLETSAEVVAVSLPTPRVMVFIVERAELAREVDMPTLAKALGRDRSRALPVSLARVVDRVTRPRVFVAMGLEPTPSGRESWAGIPRWPTVEH